MQHLVKASNAQSLQAESINYRPKEAMDAHCATYIYGVNARALVVTEHRQLLQTPSDSRCCLHNDDAHIRALAEAVHSVAQRLLYSNDRSCSE